MTGDRRSIDPGIRYPTFRKMQRFYLKFFLSSTRSARGLAAFWPKNQACDIHEVACWAGSEQPGQRSEVERRRRLLVDSIDSSDATTGHSRPSETTAVKHRPASDATSVASSHAIWHATHGHSWAVASRQSSAPGFSEKFIYLLFLMIYLLLS